MWFCWMKKTSSLIEDKRNDKTQRAYNSSEPQKAHPTGEFVIVILWSLNMLLKESVDTEN